MRISDWSSDVCSSDLGQAGAVGAKDGRDVGAAELARQRVAVGQRALARQMHLFAERQYFAHRRRVVDRVAGRQQGQRQGQPPGARDQPAARQDKAAHASPSLPGGRRNQPVTIDRSPFTGPASSSIAIWTRKKRTSSQAAMKWIERADCRPANRSTSHGAVALYPGAIASPVAIISGSRPNRTPI